MGIKSRSTHTGYVTSHFPGSITSTNRRNRLAKPGEIYASHDYGIDQRLLYTVVHNVHHIVIASEFCHPHSKPSKIKPLCFEGLFIGATWNGAFFNNKQNRPPGRKTKPQSYDSESNILASRPFLFTEVTSTITQSRHSSPHTHAHTESNLQSCFVSLFYVEILSCQRRTLYWRRKRIKNQTLPTFKWNVGFFNLLLW